MKKLTFKELHLLSSHQRTARNFEFHPKVTVVRGTNDTGKSSLLKSLYETLGAEPSSRRPIWKRAKVTSLLRFDVDQTEFYMLKLGVVYCLFDVNQQLIGKYRRVTAELAPVLADLLGIRLLLPNRSTGDLETPTPPFFFIPFYIDQDSGWNATLASFSGLHQYPRWKEHVINYHVGLRTNKWYELQSQKATLEKKKAEPEQRAEALRVLRLRIGTEIAEIPFDLDVAAFKREVDFLLANCQDLARRQEKYRHEISELENERLRLDAQVEIVERAESELSKDYQYVTDDLPDDVECPICGAHYENNFAERFSIACDEDRCLTLAQELKEERQAKEAELAKLRDSLSLTAQEVNGIQSALHSKLGDLTLEDLLKRESKKQLATSIDDELESLRRMLNAISLELARLYKEIRNQHSKEKQKEIETTFSIHMNASLASLSVGGVEMKDKSILFGQLQGGGSDLPRAVLAYYSSLISTIQQHGSGALCPFVIDSPNQQEQDPLNLQRILGFIDKERPSEPQLFLGLVEDLGMDFGGKTINLTDKYSLLSPNEFGQVNEFLLPFLRQASEADDLFR